MRLIFAGTPEFAAQALAALIAAGHDIPLVLTQPDRPAGRGMKLRASPVKALALQQGLHVEQPERLKDPESWAPIIEAQADLMIVAAYGLILPQGVLDIPRLGCVNIHASLLPRWRGAAPIQRAIEAGDRETGITLMQMDAGLDTGAMLSKAALPILADDTAASLHDKLAALGAREIVALLPRLQTDAVCAEAQDEAQATYAKKIGKADAAIDWRRPAAEIDRQIRAFNPVPGAYTQLGGEAVKIWRAHPADGRGQPGEIVALGRDRLWVACADGALDLLELQKAGAKRLPLSAFLAGNPLTVGQKFE